MKTEAHFGAESTTVEECTLSDSTTGSYYREGLECNMMKIHFKAL